jgi:hypothetical protein
MSRSPLRTIGAVLTGRRLAGRLSWPTVICLRRRGTLGVGGGWIGLDALGLAGFFLWKLLPLVFLLGRLRWLALQLPIRLGP